MELSPKDIIQRYDRLESERQLWKTHWQEIGDYILPRKSQIVVKRSPGDKLNTHLFDNTAIQSCELLAGAMHSFLTNPDQPFFEFTSGDIEVDERDDVRRWFQRTSRSMHNVLNASNFQTELHETYLDLAGFGTGPLAMEEVEEEIIRFNARFIGELCAVENNVGFIDEVYFKFNWKARKIIAEYGEENVTKKVKDSFEKNDDKEFSVIICVYPKEYDPAKNTSVFKFISKHILVEDEHELRSGFFRKFPYAVPRWSKVSGETYGRSPGMTALPEAKVLNIMVKTTLEGAQKVVDPPLQAPDDGFITQVNTYPGGITYYRSGTQDYLRPVFNDARIDFGFQAIQEKQAKIRDSFYINKLELQQSQGGPMTATEVMQRREDKFMFLGPVVGRLQNELLRPIVERLYDIMERRQLIEPPPEIIRKRKLEVRFSSVLARIQRMGEVQSIMRTLQHIEPLVNAFPEAKDNLDPDKGVRYIAKLDGLPQEMIRDKDEIEKIRKARAQAQQEAIEAQKMQEMASAAGAMNQAGKV